MNPSILPVIWFLIVCLEISLYVILDGADLGIGVLSLLPQEEERRSLMMHTIGPIWDANETWLVIAGGTLFGAFPLAYGLILSALYIPVMIMIFGFMLRATAFEFRERSTRHKHFWGRMFGVGSLLAVLGQGFAAGGLLNGIKSVNGQFAGGPFDWASLITIFIAVGILFSYLVVGYSYLLKRMDYEIKQESFFKLLVTAGTTFVAFAGATLLLPQMHYIFLSRWTTEPTRSTLFFISGLIILISLILIYNAYKHQNEGWLHPLCITIFILAFAGMLVGVFPYMIPPTITIYQAASSPNTLQFMLWGIGPLLPIVLAYNWYMYHVFRKRLGSDDESYGD